MEGFVIAKAGGNVKEKIKMIASGRYDIPRPKIRISVSSIDIKVEAGETYRGSIMIFSDNNVPVKGYAVSTHYLLSLENPEFIGEKCELVYEFKGEFTEQRQIFDGEIDLITDGGEFVIPYHISVIEPAVKTSLGEIRDLFQFANLASKNWEEALSVFTSKDFLRIFLGNHPEKAILYQNLLKSASSSQAMEEFLISEHKKQPVQLSIDSTRLTIYADMPEQEYMILVHVDGEGYLGASVCTDIPGLRLSHMILRHTDFVDGTAQVSLFITEDSLNAGKKNGTITIMNGKQVLTIVVNCVFKARREKLNEEKMFLLAEHIRLKKLQAAILAEYLKFRTNKKELSDYTETTRNLIGQVREIDYDAPFYRLLEIHMSILNHESEAAESGIKSIESEEEQLVQDPVVFSYFYYLKALYYKEEESIKRAVEVIRDIYENQGHSFLCFIMLLYLDETYTGAPERQLQEMAALQAAGANSPLLYYETCDIFNRNPSMLNHLSKFILLSLNWGIRHEFVSKETVERYMGLAAREKYFDRLMFQLLTLCYRDDPKKEYLTTMCAMLIKGNRTEWKYHTYYRQGIDAGVKLIGLNEYYMKSIDYTTYEILPRQVLLYFSYSDSLYENELAYLYSNILTNQKEYEGMMDIYEPKIGSFIEKQIQRGMISRQLVFLYQQMVPALSKSEATAQYLPNIIFKKKIVCRHPGIKGVIVCHVEDEEAVYVPFVKGEAFVDVYTYHYQILLEDEQKRRYCASIPYEMTDIIVDRDYLNVSYQHNRTDKRLLLRLFCHIQKYQQSDARSISVCRSILSEGQMKKRVEAEALKVLIEHFYASYEGEKLEACLLKTDLYDYGWEDRSKMIGYLIVRRLYNCARKAIEVFGYEKVSMKQILKLASHYLKEHSEKKDELLTEMCIAAFRAGRYDTRSLAYLCTFYAGSIMEMIEIWKIAHENQVFTALIEENILAQSLFEENFSDKTFDIFDSYYEHSTSPELVIAFLRYYSYHTFMKRKQIPISMFQHLQKEIAAGAISDDFDKMALLYFYSRQDMPIEEDKIGFVQKIADDFIGQNKVLPFFRRLAKQIVLPSEVMLRTYVSYQSEPQLHVVIRYQLNEEMRTQKTFLTKQMTEILPGIYTSWFVIFQEEKMTYSILEGQEEQIMTIKNSQIEAEQYTMNGHENRFDVLNLLMVSMQLQEESTVVRLAEDYIKNTAMIDPLLTLR